MDIPNDLFNGAWLKIERANQHISELNELLNAFLKTDFYACWLERDVDARQYRLRFRRKADLPSSVGTIIGDALHNLRSALDLVASELVRRAGKPLGKHIRFPIRATRQELEATINGGEIKVAHPTILRAIIDEVRPYKGGNDALYALHALDIEDKHYNIVPTVTVSGVTFNGTIGGNAFTNVSFGATGSGEDYILAISHGTEIQGKTKPMLQVVFDKGQPFDGQPVIPTLNKLSQLIAGAVQAIQNAYIKSIQPAP